jgi:hypothetical protein
MNFLMLSSLSQAVIVQNVQSLSGSNAPVRNPGARLICRIDRCAYSAKKGRKRIERMRRRVRLIKGMGLS